MLAGLIKAFTQASDPPFRRVIVKGAVVAIVIFIALVSAAAWGLGHLTLTGTGWIDSTIAALGSIAAVVVALVLFPGTMVAVQGVFLDDAAEAVEHRHYPHDIGAAPPVSRALWGSLRLAVLSIVLNLLVLPLYLFPGINLAVFYTLNGYLLGREYFELVAFRHMAADEARAFRQRHTRPMFLGGVVITFLFSIPVVGWFMPAFAAAFMVHVVEGARRRSTRVRPV
jgi:uncharacterized protein involved in cysteine biosynthesis